MKTKLTIFSLLLAVFFSQVHAQSIREYSKNVGINVRFAAIVPVSDDPSSDLYIAGNYGNYLFVGRFDQAGNIQWSRKINVADTSMTINQMIKDSNGHLVIAGTSIVGSAGKAFVLKFNTVTQNVVWFRKSTVNSFFWDVAEMGPGGDYIVGGQETGNGTGNQTDDITYIVNRYTGELTLFQNLDKNVNESVEALLYDQDSNTIYTTGRYELASGISKFRWCLNKLDTAGNVEWSRYYIKSVTGTGRFYSEDMIFDEGNIVMVGSGDDEGTLPFHYLWLIKTDMDGNAIITNKYDIAGTSNDGVLAGIKRYSDGYIFNGTLHNGTSPTDVFLFNVDLSGNINWVKSYPFSTRIPTTGIYNSGSMAIVGDYIYQVGENKQDDGTLKGVFMRTPIATGDAGTCDVDVSCSLTIATNFDEFTTLTPTTSDLEFNNLTLTRSKQQLNAETTCNINALAPLIDETESDLSFNRYQNTAINNETVQIFPNPSAGIFNLNIKSNDIESVQVIITDIVGRTVKIFNCNTNENITVRINDFPSGIYHLIVTDQSHGFLESKIIELK